MAVLLTVLVGPGDAGPWESKGLKIIVFSKKKLVPYLSIAPENQFLTWAGSNFHDHYLVCRTKLVIE
jgi:hypothetical protein